MEPENPPPSTTAPVANRTEPVVTPEPTYPSAPAQPATGDEPYPGLRWFFIGPQGLRAGWSVLLYLLFFYSFGYAFVIAMFHFHLLHNVDEFTPSTQFFEEASSVLSLLIAVGLVGIIEGRRILAYNLTGPRRLQNFFFGLAAGFLGLSALVGMLAAGGWLHFGPVALSGAAIFRFALLWGCVFLLGGFFEEGMFRCFLQFTFTRGVNFWWALGVIAVVCAYLAIFVRGNASWGVYAAALAGLLPCFILHQKAAPCSGSAGFWYAAWVTSALFGFIHIGNPNEAWIGIFAAAFIGFVFCVSVRVTGSAWWAIGCHAGWDWAETYFYGTADSGLTAQGSYMTSNPAGNPVWSGGAVGPEGSVLVLAAILFLLVLVLVYGRLSSRAMLTTA